MDFAADSVGTFAHRRQKKPGLSGADTGSKYGRHKGGEWEPVRTYRQRAKPDVCHGFILYPRRLLHRTLAYDSVKTGTM